MFEISATGRSLVQRFTTDCVCVLGCDQIHNESVQNVRIKGKKKKGRNNEREITLESLAYHNASQI